MKKINFFARSGFQPNGKYRLTLGKPSFKKSAVFFNIVQKAFDPPPLSFEHHADFAVSAGSENLI